MLRKIVISKLGAEGPIFNTRHKILSELKLTKKHSTFHNSMHKILLIDCIVRQFNTTIYCLQAHNLWFIYFPLKNWIQKTRRQTNVVLSKKNNIAWWCASISVILYRFIVNKLSDMINIKLLLIESIPSHLIHSRYLYYWIIECHINDISTHWLFVEWCALI